MSNLIRAATLKNYFEVASELQLNPQPLLQAVGLSRSMLADPEATAAMGRRGRAWVERSASPAAVAAAYEELFCQVAKDRRRPRGDCCSRRWSR